MLKVKLLNDKAKAPTVAHKGEDLGYDLYASHDQEIGPNTTAKVKTGVAVEDTRGRGFIIKDRSSLASQGVRTHGGVIDPGYRGEIMVLMSAQEFYLIKAGDKIAQMVPVFPETEDVVVVEELTTTMRGEKGFGSSGK